LGGQPGRRQSALCFIFQLEPLFYTFYVLDGKNAILLSVGSSVIGFWVGCHYIVDGKHSIFGFRQVSLLAAAAITSMELILDWLYKYCNISSHMNLTKQIINYLNIIL
jgi:hypothetical protein